MDHKTFETVLAGRLAKTQAVLGSKSKEYSSGDDRMHNFVRAGAMLGVSREKAALGMAAKHFVSVLDMVDAANTQKLSTAMIEEKFGDAINYLILLEAMLLERAAFSEVAK
jgi:hypothetical protein